VPTATSSLLEPLTPADFTDVATLTLGPSPLSPEAAAEAANAAHARLGAAGASVAQLPSPAEAAAAASAAAVTFEAHAPAVFRSLRRLVFGMGEDDYWRCMCALPLSRAGAGSGKSGSYFLFSADRRLIVKSVKGSEFPFLVRILSAYAEHMEANAFHSLLPRFLGLYKLKLPKQPAERLLVMNNVFYCPPESRPSAGLCSGSGSSSGGGMVLDAVSADPEVAMIEEAELAALLARQARAASAFSSAHNSAHSGGGSGGGGSVHGGGGAGGSSGGGGGGGLNSSSATAVTKLTHAEVVRLQRLMARSAGRQRLAAVARGEAAELERLRAKQSARPPALSLAEAERLKVLTRRAEGTSSPATASSTDCSLLSPSSSFSARQRSAGTASPPTAEAAAVARTLSVREAGGTSGEVVGAALRRNAALSVPGVQTALAQAAALAAVAVDAAAAAASGGEVTDLSSALSSGQALPTTRPPQQQPRPQAPAVVLSQVFDLKGSLLKRFVTEEEVARGETVFKDLNFCRHHHGTDNKGNAVPLLGAGCRKLHVGPERWPALVAAIMNDVEWLKDHNIMDYSLLVGMAVLPTATASSLPLSPSSTLSSSPLSPPVEKQEPKPEPLLAPPKAANEPIGATAAVADEAAVAKAAAVGSAVVASPGPAPDGSDGGISPDGDAPASPEAPPDAPPEASPEEVMAGLAELLDGVGLGVFLSPLADRGCSSVKALAALPAEALAACGLKKAHVAKLQRALKALAKDGPAKEMAKEMAEEMAKAREKEEVRQRPQQPPQPAAPAHPAPLSAPETEAETGAPLEAASEAAAAGGGEGGGMSSAPEPLSAPPFGAPPAPPPREGGAATADAAAAAAPPVEVKWSHLSPACYAEWVADHGGLRARGPREEAKAVVYYVGIIDILQEFNMTKRLESAYKQRLQMLAGKDPTLISAVDASVYSKRFLEFITSHID